MNTRYYRFSTRWYAPQMALRRRMGTVRKWFLTGWNVESPPFSRYGVGASERCVRVLGFEVCLNSISVRDWLNSQASNAGRGRIR